MLVNLMSELQVKDLLNLCPMHLRGHACKMQRASLHYELSITTLCLDLPYFHRLTQHCEA